MQTAAMPPGTILQWEQPKWSVERYELRAGGETLGELTWTKCLSDEAFARHGQSSWLLDRSGFFRDRVVAIEHQRKILAATCTFDWLKDGNLVLADGRSFRWTRTRLLDTAWALTDSEGRPVFEIGLGMKWFKHQAVVRLGPAAHEAPELGLLLCMGMYLSMCTMQDMAGAVAATTAAIG